MEDEEELIKLIRLNEAKDKFLLMLRNDLSIENNYKRAKELFQNYADIYKEITGEEPSKTFEELV